MPHQDCPSQAHSRRLPLIAASACVTLLASCASTHRDELAATARFTNLDALTAPGMASDTPSVATEQPATFQPGHFASKRLPQDGLVSQPRGMFYIRGGAGDAELEQVIGALSGKTDTNAGMGEIGFEATGKVMGGGLRFGAWSTDDDDLSGPGSQQRGDGAHFFAHLTIRPGGSRFRVPIRIGPDIRANALEENLPSLEDIDFTSIGAAIEVEPEFDFFRSDRAALSIYGRLHAGAGVGQISDESNDFDTEATHLGGEFGVRLQLRKFLLSGGYIMQSTEYDVGDPDGAVAFPYGENTWSFEGIFLMIGVRW